MAWLTLSLAIQGKILTSSSTPRPWWFVPYPTQIRSRLENTLDKGFPPFILCWAPTLQYGATWICSKLAQNWATHVWLLGPGMGVRIWHPPLQPTWMWISLVPSSPSQNVLTPSYSTLCATQQKRTSSGKNRGCIWPSWAGMDLHNCPADLQIITMCLRAFLQRLVDAEDLCRLKCCWKTNWEFPDLWCTVLVIHV